ncbi:leucine-rich repeat-containing protein 40-like [Ptychodera flava]|uniref:leucine-rich repeat-containing protein 40-like n=1 Tax=Ptychodera flava TaxID=63121 RepID=UPI003969E67A
MAKVINLSGRALLSLPVDICEQKSLRSLDCKHNHISSLPNKFRQLVNLRILLLGSNNFSEMPSTIGKLTNLAVLDVSYNRLTTIPDSICELVQLEYLDASYNKITSLPRQFGWKLRHLKKLFLYGNPLEDPPLEVCNNGMRAIRQYEKTTQGVEFLKESVAIIGDCVINNFNKGTLLGNVRTTVLKRGNIKSIRKHVTKHADLQGVQTLIIHGGTQDCGEGKMSVIKESASELRETIRDLRNKYNHLTIIVSAVVPRNDYYFNDCRVMNDLFRQVCKEESCGFVDHEGAFMRKTGTLDSHLYTRDGVHLNSRGTLRLATSLNKVVPILKNHDQNRVKSAKLTSS